MKTCLPIISCCSRPDLIKEEKLHGFRLISYPLIKALSCTHTHTHMLHTHSDDGGLDLKGNFKSSRSDKSGYGEEGSCAREGSVTASSGACGKRLRVGVFPRV